MNKCAQALFLSLVCNSYSHGMNVDSACTEKAYGCWKNINERIFFEAVCENCQILVRKMLDWKLIDPDYAVEPYVCAKTTLTEIEADESIYIVNFLTAHLHPAHQQTKETALMYAIVCGHEEIVRLLLDAHANPVIQNRCGLTPLMLAAFKGNLGIMRLLRTALQSYYGAGHESRFINAQSFSGTTALMFAVSRGNIGATQLLIETGANPALANKRGLSVHTLVQNSKNLSDQSKACFMALFEGRLHLVPQRKKEIEIPEDTSNMSV